jgi:pyruvate formate lyase activating enzyme
MRCLYCYNPEIVLGKGNLSFAEAISFLKTRTGLLDAVVFSGGECTLHKNFYNQVEVVKKFGFLVKIDTNGSNPEVLQQLINEKAIDYVALDFKAPKSKFNTITQSKDYASFEKTLEILLKNAISFEIRTTLHSELLTILDINEMITYLSQLGFQGNYYVQNFKNNVPTLGNLVSSFKLNEKQITTTSNINVVFRN